MTIDATAAAVDAIVTRLSTVLGSGGSGVLSSVIAGWPEDNVSLDLSGDPVVSVTPGGEVRTDVAPRSLGSSTSGDVTTYTYRVATLEFVAQVDVWCAYKDQLRDVCPLIEAAFGQAPPRPAVIQLTSTGYYNRPVVCHLGAFRADQDGDSAKKGEWRGSWDVRVQTDIVRTTPHTPQTRVDVEMTVDAGTAETLTVLTA